MAPGTFVIGCRQLISCAAATFVIGYRRGLKEGTAAICAMGYWNQLTGGAAAATCVIGYWKGLIGGAAATCVMGYWNGLP